MSSSGTRAGWRRIFPDVGQRAIREGMALMALGTAPLELRILGRTLFHTALVGGAAGLLGAGFFGALELAQRLFLDGFARYSPLRAAGEMGLTSVEGDARLWLLAVLPALGGLASGLLTWRFAPEAAGGGGDAIIEAYHQGGPIRRRVIPVKTLAAVLTLGTGGSGGREGPTMQIGGALGSAVGRLVGTTARERRILVVAGIAAGIAAVFRTPLGAALLATEMLYRDDFESEALIPAVLGSVLAYAISSSLLGETTLFGQLPHTPFIALHLPLYALLSLVIACAGVAMVALLRAVGRFTARLRVPPWTRPAMGGLAMGVLGVGVVVLLRSWPATQVRGLGVFGGGYGAAQVAISGHPGLPAGWPLVFLLLFLAAAKLVASCLTVGSGGAAGDFAPSLVIGALVGSAFGTSASLLLGDSRIHPGAFALVGMACLYGGIAHTPLSAVILVAELAGSYDLLVPLMLSVGIAFVLLQRWSLYPAQPRARADSPAHRREFSHPPALDRVRAGELLVVPELPAVPQTLPLRQLRERAYGTRRQLVCVVLDSAGKPNGLVDLSEVLTVEDSALDITLAMDAAVPYAWVSPEALLGAVRDVLAVAEMPQVPVMAGETLLGYVGQSEVAMAIVRAFAEGTGPAQDG